MQHRTVEYDASTCSYDFPRDFARKRTKIDIWDKYILSGIIAGVGSYCSPLPWYEFLICSNAYCYCLFFILELISRIGSFREEYSHLESRYEGRLLILLQKLFRPNLPTGIFLMVSILIIVVREIIGAMITNENIWKYLNLGGIFPWICSIVAMKLFVDNIEMDDSIVKFAKLIDRIHGLDYGSGMAISYFYGYLNIVLPSTGEQRKGLREHIEDFSGKHKITFASTKLFIFLPKSAKCPEKVSDYSPKHIVEQCQHMEPIIINRGGQRNRKYATTVYKIETIETGKKVSRYVCAEFASALQTFYEVMDFTHSVTSFYREYRREIVTNFYMTLHKLLQEKDLSHLCELIYFEDRDANNQIIYLDRLGLDIGDLILDKINQLENRPNDA